MVRREIKGPVVQSCPRIPKLAERGVKNSAGGFDGGLGGFYMFCPRTPTLYTTSYGVNTSQLFVLLECPGIDDDFNTRNKVLTANFPDKDIYIYIYLRKEFSQFYRRHFDLVSKLQDLSEPEFYGCLVYKK